MSSVIEQTQNKENCPLCSLVIVTYNQENFIRHTLQGAFAQTYPNLEIIVSDDASRDKTWEIIQKMVQTYQGPHQIVLNRNENNLGVGGGAGKAMQLAKGEIIVWNDGDDVSHPERVQCICKAFNQQGPDTMMIRPNHEPIDAQGNNLGPYKNFEKDVRKKTRSLSEIHRRIRIPFGAVTAWRRVVSDSFDGISSSYAGWDNIVAFRALLLGRVGFVPDVLVQYRTHAASTLNAPATDDLVKDYRKRARERDAWYIQAFSQHLIDIHKIVRKSPDRSVELLKIERMIVKQIHKSVLSFEIMSFFPKLSMGLLIRALRWPEFYRYFLLAPLYRLGWYKRR